MNPETHIEGIFRDSIETKQLAAQTLAPAIARAAQVMIGSLENGHKALLLGLLGLLSHVILEVAS